MVRPISLPSSEAAILLQSQSFEGSTIMSKKTEVILLGLLISVCASSTPGQECYHWIDRKPPSPGPHSAAKTAYDSKRNVLVVMGSTYGPNTWEWDGSVWRLGSGATPSMGSAHEAVFDSVRGVTVVFVGLTSPATWEWDGLTWLLRSQAGPGPRYSFEMAFDSQRGVTVLHGGRDPSNNQLFLNDTWEWNGSSWVLRSTSGPTRAEHVMGFDSLRGVTVLHGGREVSSSGKRDTWEWDGASWVQVAIDQAPYPYAAAEMVFDSVRNLMVMFYEYGPSGWLEEWTWDGTVWRTSEMPGPIPRSKASLAFDSLRGVTVLFGGDGWGDLWEWDGSNWVLQWGGESRTSAIAYDRAQDRIVAVEGWGGISRIWARENEQWSLIDSNGPEVGTDPAIAYDEVRNVLVFFGGSNPSSGPSDPDVYFGNTWEWDGAIWSLRATDGPVGRGRHRMVYDASRGVTVLFGGWNGDELGDTWEWDGVAWSLRSTTGPSPRYWSGFSYDRQRNVSLLVGGGNGGYPFAVGGIWEWNGQSWTQGGATDQISRRFLPALIYDELRNVHVLVGGYLNWFEGPWYLFGTFERDGKAWINRTMTGVVAGTGVYDVASGKSLVLSDAFPFYGIKNWEYFHEVLPPAAPVAESWGEASESLPAVKNRYLSFSPPALPNGASGLALRVTADQMPGAANCPNVPDFSDRFQDEMWVGGEVIQGNTATGVYALSSWPVLRDWSTVPGGVVHVADCNIVPCASYIVEAVSDVPCDAGVPSVFSEPIVLSTSSVWGDLVGGGSNQLPNGIVDFVDIAASVECFRDTATAPPRTWCDLGGSSPYQGADFNIDFSDIALVVDAFRGRSYPFAGPTAPNPCP